MLLGPPKSFFAISSLLACIFVSYSSYVILSSILNGINENGGCPINLLFFFKSSIFFAPLFSKSFQGYYFQPKDEPRAVLVCMGLTQCQLAGMHKHKCLLAPIDPTIRRSDEVLKYMYLPVL